MFNPNLHTTITFEGQTWRFAPHPAIPSMVWGQEGRHAVVYQLVPQAGGDPLALKVFRPAFRHDGLISAAEALYPYHELPGMRVSRQMVLLNETHPALISAHPDLDHAIVMPWISGQTWFDILQERRALNPDQSRTLAESTAWVLYALELNNLAHCDLSSGNLIVGEDFLNVNLIDVEAIYSPWVEPPPYVPLGSAGYQHGAAARAGQWGPVGDRFAGAVLMAEMLGWAHKRVRAAAWGESYFAPDELQHDSERYSLLRDVLRVYHPAFAEAFEQAWRSHRLEGCPPLKTWYDVLDSLPREPVTHWAPLDPAAFGPDEAPAPQAGGPEIVYQPKPTFWGRLRRFGCRTAFILTLLISFTCLFASLALFIWLGISGSGP